MGAGGGTRFSLLWLLLGLVEGGGTGAGGDSSHHAHSAATNTAASAPTRVLSVGMAERVEARCMWVFVCMDGEDGLSFFACFGVF